MYSPHWLTADSLLLAGQDQGFADVNDNEVTSSGQCLAWVAVGTVYYPFPALLSSSAVLLIPSTLVGSLSTVIIFDTEHLSQILYGFFFKRPISEG